MAVAQNHTKEMGALTLYHATEANRGGYLIVLNGAGYTSQTITNATEVSCTVSGVPTDHFDVVGSGGTRPGFIFPKSGATIGAGPYVFTVTLRFSTYPTDPDETIDVTLTTSGNSATLDLNGNPYNLANTYHVDLVQAFLNVTAQAAAAKSGKNILLRPGDYTLPGGNGDLAGDFNDLTSTLTIASADSNNQAAFVAGTGCFGVFTTSDPAVSACGNVTLSNLIFRGATANFTSSGLINISGSTGGLIASARRPVNVTIDGCTFYCSDMVKGRLYESPTDPNSPSYPFAVRALACNGLTITNCTFHTLMYALSLGASDVLVSDNLFYELWADAINQNFVEAVAGVSCVGVTIRNNHYHSMSGNNGLHPDFFQTGYPVPTLWDGTASTGPGIGDPSNWTIEGNVVYYNTEGHLTPPCTDVTNRQALSTSSFTAVPASGASAPLYRIDTRSSAVTVTLPDISTVTNGHKCAVQLLFYTNALTVQVTGADVLYDTDEAATMASPLSYGRPSQTYTFTKTTTPSTRWNVSRQAGDCQMIFCSGALYPATCSNFVIRFNLLYTTSIHGISMDNPGFDGASVYNNSVMQPFPGDANGDGTANTRFENFNKYTDGQIIKTKSSNWSVRANVCGDVQQTAPGTGMTVEANYEGNYRSDFASFAAAFSPDSSSTALVLPTTKAEAIRMARPNASRTLPYGVGALGINAADDIWDWDTGTYKVNTPWYVLDLATISAGLNGYTISGWKAPSADGGSAVTGYTVEESLDYDPNGAAGNGTWTAATGYDGTSLSFTRVNHTANQRIYVRVRPINANGTGSYYRVQSVLPTKKLSGTLVPA